MDIFCRAGNVQQAQQSTHLAEGLNPLWLVTKADPVVKFNFRQCSVSSAVNPTGWKTSSTLVFSSAALALQVQTDLLLWIYHGFVPGWQWPASPEVNPLAGILNLALTISNLHRKTKLRNKSSKAHQAKHSAYYQYKGKGKWSCKPFQTSTCKHHQFCRHLQLVPSAATIL